MFGGKTMWTECDSVPPKLLHNLDYAQNPSMSELACLRQ